MDLRPWMEKMGVDLTPRIQIRTSKLGGVGVFATEDLVEDEILLHVPKSAILSAKTCGIANLLEGMESITGTVIAYLFERAQGKSSPWHPYIQSIEAAPVPDIPRLWPEGEKVPLFGTDIDAIHGLDATGISSYYEDARPVFSENVSLFGPKPVDLEEFADALIKVSSRVFDVDNYHGLSLVPGACLFNHSDRESVHFETDGDVCILCGSLECGCLPAEFDEANWVNMDSEDDDGDEENEASEEDFNNDSSDHEHDNDHEDMDTDNDSESIANGEVENETDEGEEHEDEEGSEVDVQSENSAAADLDSEDNSCVVRVIVPVSAGKEVFNTYGEEPNAMLLGRYGFTILDNVHEVVDIKAEIEDWCREKKCSRKLKSWMHRKLAEAAAEDSESEEDGEEELLFGVNIDGQVTNELEDFLQDFNADISHLALKRLEKFRISQSSAEIRAILSSRELTDRDTNILIFTATQKGILEKLIPTN